MIIEIVQKIVDSYQALDMCMKTILLVKRNLFFFHQIIKSVEFLNFGNGINLLGSNVYLKKYYDKLITIDLSVLEPHINGPFSPDIATPISQMKEVAKKK